MDWISYAQQIDVANLIAIAVVSLIGYRFMGKKIDKLEVKVDKMQETITDIDRRLCRLEGAFQAKECCLLKSDLQHKVAE